MVFGMCAVGLIEAFESNFICILLLAPGAYEQETVFAVVESARLVAARRVHVHRIHTRRVLGYE